MVLKLVKSCIKNESTIGENKSYILTKKQIDYLNGDAIIKNASGVWIINKNIRKRVESCYANDKLKKERIKKLKIE